MQCWKMEFDPPPAVQKAEFTRTGATVLLDLDGPSDHAGMDAGDYFACSDVLEFDDVETCWCYWVNSTQLEVQVNTAEAFLPGDEIGTLGGRLKTKCEEGARCDCYK